MRPTFVWVLAAIALPFFATPSVAVIDLDSFTGPAPKAFTGFLPNTSVNPASTNYTAGSTSRLAFYVPGTVWQTYPGWLTFYKMLVMIGIPTRVVTNYTVAIQHPVVLAYQAFTGTVAAAESTAWKNYVAGGKTLITTTFTSTDTTMRTLFGVIPDAVTNATLRDVILLQDVTTAPGSNYMSQINWTDTRDSQIPLWGTYINTSFPTVGYKSNAKTVVALGKYRHQSNQQTEADYSISMNIPAAKSGQAIAFGLDIGRYIGISQGNNTWGIPRDYAATYEPGYDTFLRLIKTMYVSNAGYVTIWPVPSNMGVHYVWSYDIDASPSWAGAVNITKALAAWGVGGTINWQTKLVTDAYDIDFFTQYWQNISIVESYGNMELASHSVSHSINLGNFSVGTGLEIYNGTRFQEGAQYWPFIGQCLNNTPTVFYTDIPNSTYCDTPTNVYWFYTIQDSLYAEVSISKFLLETISTKGSIVRSYRTGHLIFPNAMPDIWAQTGIKYTSSGASNDQNTHLPYQLFSDRGYAQELDVYEFSMTTSDEDLDPMNNVWAVPGTPNYTEGSALFQQVLLLNKIAKYGGSYTFLLHPTSFGVGIPWATNVQLFDDKYAFQQAFQPLITGICYFDTMAGRGDFTWARVRTGVDWVISGTNATVTVTAPYAIKNLTLHFPTTWVLLSANTLVSTSSGAVILKGSIAPGTYTLVFSTVTTTKKATFPSTTPTATFPVVTSAAPTSTRPAEPSNIVIIDDFTNPQQYNNQNNSIGQYTYDDKTTIDRTSVQGDWLYIYANTSSYWYTLLGPANTCNNYSAYSAVQFAFRFPGGNPCSFSVNLQDVAADCTTATANYVPIGANTTYPFTTSTDWQIVSLPFTAFNVTSSALKAITLARFTATCSVEVDYVYITK